MIPPFTDQFVIPPFISCPTQRTNCSPYKVSIVNFVKHFGFSDKRKELLANFLEFRNILNKYQILQGFQWIDGSFIEDKFNKYNEEPNDIDVVTFADLRVYQENCPEEVASLFDPGQSKMNWKCDNYFVDLSRDSRYIVENTKYWYGLFSHQRMTHLWKGMIQIELNDTTESEALRIVTGGSL